ncbi:hypothetical protein Tco_1527105 [Tanacetum coccineum]
MVRLMVSSIYEAWIRANEQYLLVFIRVCDVPNRRANGLLWKKNRMACSLPHTDSEVEALVQRIINEDKGRQDALLNLAFQFEDSCAVRDGLRKAYEKCNDIP